MPQYNVQKVSTFGSLIRGKFQVFHEYLSHSVKFLFGSSSGAYRVLIHEKKTEKTSATVPEKIIFGTY